MQTRREADLSWLADVDRSRRVVSFSAGINLAEARGVVLKIVFWDGHSELLLIPPGLIQWLRDSCKRFLAGPGAAPDDSRIAEEVFIKRQPDMSQSDFSSVTQKEVAVQAGFLATKKALGMALTFTDSSCLGYIMHPTIVFHLGHYLAEAAPQNVPIPGKDITAG